MSAEQWNKSPAQVGFGDEFVSENLIDSWPSSSQSPGVSPQPSPDSQLLEPSPQTTTEATTNLSEKLSVPSQQNQQSHGYQSPFISQSNQPVIKDNTQASPDKRNFPFSDSQPYCKAEAVPSFNKSFPASPHAPRPRPVAFSQQSPPKFQGRNVTGPPPGQPINQGPNPNRPVRPFPPQSGAQQVRPLNNQPFVSNQGIRNPQVSNQSFRPKPPFQNVNHPQQRGPQQQQQQYPPNVSRPQQNQQSAQNQNSQLKPPHTQLHQSRSNPQFPHQAPNQQFPPRPASQTHQNAPNNPRFHAPGVQRPRMMAAPVQRHATNVGRGIHPNSNSIVRPNHISNMNQQGNVRFAKPNINQTGPMRPPGIRPNMPPPGMDRYDEEYDEFDDENEMYYDDEDDDFEEAEEEMYNQQHNFQPGFDYQNSDDSDGSDEEQILLEELIHCENEERYQLLCRELHAKGVTKEEIDEYKDNYSRNTYDEDMDYDDDDMDEDEEEEMVSSSSMVMARNTNPMQQSSSIRPPLSGPPASSAVPQQQAGNPPPQTSNRPPPQTSSHLPFSPPGLQQGTPRPQGPGPSNPPRPPIPRTQTLPLPQRKPPGPIGQTNPSNNEAVQQSSYQAPQPKPPIPAASTQPGTPSQRQGSIPPAVTPIARGSVGLQSGPRMPCPINSSSSQINQSSAHGLSQSPSHIHQSYPATGLHSGNAGYIPNQQLPVSPGVRPPMRHTGPAHRFTHAQTPPSPAQGMHGMQTAPSQLKAALMSNKPPTDAHQARQTVLKMQERLDAEIMAKKRPQQNNTFPLPHPHSMIGNQTMRPPHLTSSPMVRHKLPPRTPIPHMPGSRPFPNFNDHQSTGGNPRLQGPRPRPRPPTPQSSQFGISSGQSQNPGRFSSPVPPHSAVTSNHPLPSQQTMTSPSAVRTPGPALSQSQSHAPSPNPGPLQQQELNQQQGHNQQSSQNAHKPDTFNLGGLSEDKCIVKGRQGLITNMLYQIRSPIDQTLVLARWNGERFEDLGPNDERQLQQAGVITPSSSTPQAKATVEDHPPTPVPADTNSGSPALSNQSSGNQQTQNQKSNEDVNSQSTYVKPLSEDTEDKKPEEQDEDDDDEFIFKKPFSENEEVYRVCKHCGYTSKNFKRCEGCRRIFQGEVKIHQKRKPNAPEPVATSPGNNTNNSSQAKSISKLDGWTPDGERRAEQEYITLQPKMPVERFYGSVPPRRGRGRRPARGMMGRTRGGGMKGRMGSGPGEDDYDSSDSEEPFDKPPSRGSMKGLPGGKKRVPRGRGKSPGGPRKRPKKLDEPVTVMISSDEDEPSSTSNSFMGIPPPQSPASSAGSGSPIFPGTPTEPTGAFGRFRRVKMEDEQGNSKLTKKMEQQTMVSMGMDEEDDDDDEDGDEPPTYQIEIRSVRVGSMRTKPEGPLFINMRGVCFRVKSERTEELFECEIMSTEVEHVKYYGGQSQPVLFFLLTQESGEKLRNVFHMEEGGDEYLDPSSTDMKQKMVVIIIESLDYLPQDMRETLSLWADINNAEDGEFIEELSEESANDLLIQSAPPVLTADLEHHVVSFKKGYLKTPRSATLMPRAPNSPQNTNDNEPDSTSSSPPQEADLRRYFEGPPVRLLQYPPPPARGIGITTEDLFCLNEGEFLNDVIIDFYLQYLHAEMLSEEMKKRTHIFSSFFYKRLTQKDRHSEKTEEDAKKSLPERRHARVKKWTKTVDLFSKDFIIVPINEHSHWYLAVICFPGLATPEVVPFIPNTSHTEETDNDSNNPDGEPQEDGGAAPEGGTSSQPEPVVKTVFGKHLDPEKCSKSDESNCSMGQKQPCILIFDSLLGPSRNPNVKMLRDYLQCEWNAKKSEPRLISKILRGSTPKVPQQSNYSDCGVYLLQYVESFFEDPIADFQIPMKGLQHWFTENLIVNKREDIHNLIMKLHRRFQEERGDPNILDIKYDSAPPPSWAPPPNHPHPPPLLRPLPPQDQPWSDDPTDGQEMPNGNNRGDPTGMSMDSGDSSQSGSLPDADDLQNSSTSNSNHNIATTSNKESSSSSSLLLLSPSKDHVPIPPLSFFDDPPTFTEEDSKESKSDSATTKMEVDEEEDAKVNNSNFPHPLVDQISHPPEAEKGELSATASDMQCDETKRMNSENDKDDDTQGPEKDGGEDS